MSRTLPKPKDLSVSDVAEQMAIAEETVKRWIRAGDLAAYRWGPGGRWMVKPADLVRYLKARGVPVERGRRVTRRT